jgi:hypothetical protein
MSNTIPLIILSVLVGGAALGIALQIFLSRRESKWLGLILPFISFCFSLTALLGIAVSTTVRTGSFTTSETGEVAGRAAESVINAPVADGLPFMILSTFVIYNIPTAVLLLIYLACREKRKARRALEKMSVQDLE